VSHCTHSPALAPASFLHAIILACNAILQHAFPQHSQPQHQAHVHELLTTMVPTTCILLYHVHPTSYPSATPPPPRPPHTLHTPHTQELPSRIEDLSKHLDVVELQLLREISARSSSFFEAAGSLQALRTVVSDTVAHVQQLQNQVETMDKAVFKAAADVTKLQRRRRNLAEALALAKVGGGRLPLGTWRASSAAHPVLPVAELSVTVLSVTVLSVAEAGCEGAGDCPMACRWCRV
jgi:hypothetical protein